MKKLNKNYWILNPKKTNKILNRKMYKIIIHILFLIIIIKIIIMLWILLLIKLIFWINKSNQFWTISAITINFIKIIIINNYSSNHLKLIQVSIQIRNWIINNKNNYNNTRFHLKMSFELKWTNSTITKMCSKIASKRTKFKILSKIRKKVKI